MPTVRKLTKKTSVSATKALRRYAEAKDIAVAIDVMRRSRQVRLYGKLYEPQKLRYAIISD